MADIAQDAQISPDDTAIAGASKLFFHLWNAAWQHGEGTTNGDADALHDMRVGLRRLRTAMSNFEGSKDEPLFSKSLRLEIRGAQRDIGKLGDKLGAVRDFDVLQGYVRDYAQKQLKTPLEASPGLAEMLEGLQNERDAAFKPMTKTLKRAQKEDGLREEFGRWALGIPAAKAAAISYADAAKIILPQRIEEVFSHENSLHEEAHPEEKHELRKSLRRLRYTLETLSVCFPKPIKPMVKKLVEMQDVLGEMQDREVLKTATERLFGDKVPADVVEFNAHGTRREEELLGEVRGLWKKAEAGRLWLDLRAL